MRYVTAELDICSKRLDQLSQPFLSSLEIIHVQALTDVQYLMALDVLCSVDELIQDTASQSALPNYEELLRPRIIQALEDHLAAAQ